MSILLFDKYVPLKSIPNNHTSIVVYLNILSKMEKRDLKNGEVLLKILGDTIFNKKFVLFEKADKLSRECSPKICYTLSDLNVNGKVIPPESVLIVGYIFNRKNKDLLHELMKNNVVTGVYEDCLPVVYLDNKLRRKYRKLIKRKLKKIREREVGEQCISSLLTEDTLGTGCYGSVSSCDIEGFHSALKLAKIRDDSVKRPYSADHSSWHETYILNNLFRPLFKKNVCPNLPLIYSSLFCTHCKVNIKNGQHHCVGNVMELASQNLKMWLASKPSENELLNALFQIMYGIATYQIYFQLQNYDIKKENILIYSIEPGGYFLYTLGSTSFAVPNIGKLFVVNDFGISQCFSPSIEMYRRESEKTRSLGTRCGVIVRNTLIPFDVKNTTDKHGSILLSKKVKWKKRGVMGCGEFRIKRTGEVIKLDIVPNKEMEKWMKRVNSSPTSTTFFSHPLKVPPLEFYCDTQDAIRMFLGGKRTTQDGNHSDPKIDENFRKKLLKYRSKPDTLEKQPYPTRADTITAYHFILSFFKKNGLYSPSGVDNSEIIATYKLPTDLE